MRSVALLCVLLLVAVSLPAGLRKMVRAQPTILGDTQTVGAVGPYGVEVHPFAGDEVSYVAVSGAVGHSGLCVVPWQDDIYDVEGDDDLREVVALSRNRRFLFAISPTHVHVLQFNATGVTWLHKVEVAHSPVVRLQPIGDSDGFHAFIRPYDTMTPHFQPTGSWERWEGGVLKGSMGPTMFGTPSMGWMGIGLVTTDAANTEAVGIQNLQLTPTTHVPFGGCRLGPDGYPDPCDVDGYVIVPAIDVNHSATTEQVLVPLISGWAEDVLIPVALFSNPAWPGAVTILAKQVETGMTNTSLPNVEWYLDSTAFSAAARLTAYTEEGFSWVEHGLTTTSSLTQLTGLCNRLPTVVNSSYLDLGVVHFELDETGFTLYMYCGGTTIGQVGSPNKLFSIEFDARSGDFALPISNVPDYSTFTVASATISGDLTAPTPEVTSIISMSRPTRIGLYNHFRVCDDTDCVRVEHAASTIPPPRPEVSMGSHLIGPWVAASAPTSSSPSSSPSIPLASLPELPLVLYQEAVQATLDPYLRFRCVFGPCTHEAFEIELTQVPATEAPLPVVPAPMAWSGSIPEGVVDEAGVYLGHSFYYFNAASRSNGEVAFSTFDPSQEATAYTKTFGFHDKSDELPDLLWHAVLNDTDGKPTILVTCRVGDPDLLYLFNISGSQMIDDPMSMPGLLVPTTISVDEAPGETGPTWGEEGPIFSAYDVFTSGPHAGKTLFAFLGDTTIQFGILNPLDAEEALTVFSGVSHGFTVSGSDVDVIWMTLDATNSLAMFYIYNSDTPADSEIGVIKLSGIMDDEVTEVSTTSIAVNDDTATALSRHYAAITYGANHVLLMEAHGILRYSISQTTGVVSMGTPDYLTLPGSPTRDLSNGYIVCSRRSPMCVAAYLNELLVILHTQTSVGTGIGDAFVHQHLLLPIPASSTNNLPYSVNGGLYHASGPPISFSPDGTTVAISATPAPSLDSEMGDPISEAILLYSIDPILGTLTYRETFEVTGGVHIRGSLTWRPDSRSVFFQLSNDTVVDLTLYAPAAAPELMPTTRKDMYAPFSFQVSVDEECTFAHVTLTADMKGETAGTTSTIYFTEVMPDGGIEGGMLTFQIDPCMLDNSRTVPASAGTYAGTTGSPTQEGDVMFTVTCTTPTGQSTTSDPMALYLKCMPTAYSKVLEIGDAFTIIIMVLCSLVIATALMGGFGVVYSRIVGKPASGQRTVSRGLARRSTAGYMSTPTLDEF